VQPLHAVAAFKRFVKAGKTGTGCIHEGTISWAAKKARMTTKKKRCKL